ncbi:hypothetical protein [Deinococcus pimensis]|uniref:hypothetical protein n=1 Tax=Deinococcus pimensis TaxID=309888 RepID=UPI00047FDF7D|nr:hypothetical protein [Deinococcus pimensis]
MPNRFNIVIDDHHTLTGRPRGGRGRTFLLLLLGGGTYLILRNPERRSRVQTKVQAYRDAARQGRLGDVARHDFGVVQSTAQDWRQKATKAMNAARKGQQVAQVAKEGVSPMTKLAEDASVILSSDDPQRVGRAVQDAKAQLGSLAATGREVTQVLEGEQPEGASADPAGRRTT